MNLSCYGNSDSPVSYTAVCTVTQMSVLIAYSKLFGYFVTDLRVVHFCAHAVTYILFTMATTTIPQSQDFVHKILKRDD